jgi:site-specific recombinase XerD
MASPKKDRWVDQFISYLEAERSASPRTVIAYRHALQQFRAFRGGEVAWHSVSVSEFREFLLACMKEDMARSYVRLTFAALRSFYRFLTERAGLSANPLKEVSLPKLEKKLPIVLSIAQVSELLDKPNQVQKKNQAPVWAISRDVAILELFYSSGLRLSELVALDVADVDVYAESVRVLGKGRTSWRLSVAGHPEISAAIRGLLWATFYQ